MPEANSFALWGAEHIAVLVLTAAGAAALLGARRRLRGTDDRRPRRLAALALLGNEAAAWMVGAARGVYHVPFQLCDLALAMTVWALWSLRPLPCELAYFWGLAGSLQAILTPDLRRAFPDYWWVKFFATHCGIVLAATYLAVTGRVAPAPGAVWRIWGITNAYAAAAGFVNWRWGTNYGYLAVKPSQPSLLDSFGPWPYYILVMEAAALALFFLACAPLVLVKRADCPRR